MKKNSHDPKTYLIQTTKEPKPYGCLAAITNFMTPCLRKLNPTVAYRLLEQLFPYRITAIERFITTHGCSSLA